MKTSNQPPSSPKNFKLKFHNVRHISCPEDLENNRRIYTGHTPIWSVIDLSTDENVRDYLLEAEGKKRRRPTQVHKAILDTLENYSHNFSVLNSGIVIVARDCEIDEKNKQLVLHRASIINGAQTQGIIRDFVKSRNGDLLPVHVKFEVIVTDDEDLIAEISIARNFQNDVMSLTIAGRLGQLDELEESLRAKLPGSKLQKSETQLSQDYTKTERLLQVITALVPHDLWPRPGEVNKVYTYSRKAQCLKEFRDIYKKAHNRKDPQHHKSKKLYQFYLDIVADAGQLYAKWKQHQGFQGTGLRALKRNKKGEIVDVPDGIVFPILAALSEFVEKTKDGWRIVYPDLFKDEELIRVAKAGYTEIAKSEPNKMGKTKACYSALNEITSLYKKLSK